MKKKQMMLLAFSLVLFTGCHAQSSQEDEVKNVSKVLQQSRVTRKKTRKSSTPSSEIKESGSSNETKQVVNSSEMSQTLWNSEKAQQLQQFMSSWGATMGQEYHEYKEGHSIKHYLFEVPDQILSGDYPFVVNNEREDFSWSKDGESGSGYKAVAVYSDLEPGSYELEKHTYLFAIYNGEPKVLIATLHGQHEAYYAAFVETENQELKNGFAQIVNGTNSLSKQPEKAVNTGIVAGYSNQQVQAARVWFTKFDRENGSAIDPDAYYSITHLEAGSAIAPIPNSVNFSKPAISILATPTAAGGVTYTDNGDGTVTIYDIPLHFQDERYMDASYSREFTQAILDKAQTISLGNFSEEQLMTFLTRLK